jgi:hypothetical protein
LVGHRSGLRIVARDIALLQIVLAGGMAAALAVSLAYR